MEAKLFQTVRSTRLLLNVTFDVLGVAATGPCDVLVTNKGGTPGTGVGLLEIVARPVISRISPEVLLAGVQGVVVKIFGTSFHEGSIFSIGGDGIQIADATIESPQAAKLTLNIAADASLGRRDVSVEYEEVSYRLSGALEVRQNQPPIVVVPESIRGSEGKLAHIVVHARDPENGPLTFSASNLPEGAKFVGHSFLWRPAYGQAGTYVVDFEVTDNYGATTSTAVTITIEEHNRPPHLGKVANHRVTAGQPLQISISASDPDGDDLSMTISGLPEAALLTDNVDGTFALSWTPVSSDAGNYHVQFRLSDQPGAIATTSTKVTVTDPGRTVNLPPEFTPVEDVTIREGATLEVEIVAADPEESPVAIYAISLPDGAVFDPLKGTFSFSPDFNQAGGYEVEFVASDGMLSVGLTFSITVEDENAAPVFLGPEELSVAEGTKLAAAVIAVDPDGETMEYGVVDIPLGASLDPQSGYFSFTPDYSQSGEYTVRVSATDPAGSSAEHSFNLIVENTNQPPVVGQVPAQSILTGEGLELPLVASDPDGDEIFWSVYADESLGELLPSAESTVLFPAEAAAGSYTLLLVARDDHGAADSGMAMVNVTETANAPPVIEENFPQTVRTNEVLLLGVEAVDPEGAELSYAIKNTASLPAGLVSIGVSDGLLEFNPSNESAGTHTVVVVVSDGETSAIAEILLTVVKNNSTPQLNIPGEIDAKEGEELEFAFEVSDSDGDFLLFELSPLPQGAEFDKNTGELNFIPGYEQSGSYQMTLTVSDGQATASGQVILNISETNRAPRIYRIGNPEAVEGELIEFEIIANDPDGDSLWIEIDLSLMPFIGSDGQSPASIRNGNILVFDTGMLDQINRIPSARVSFFAQDKHGAVSTTDFVEITVERKKNVASGNVQAGQQHNLSVPGTGVGLLLKNNSSASVSANIDVSEKSGRLRFNKRNGSTGTFLAEISEQAKERTTTYLAATGETLTFAGISRSWEFLTGDLPDSVELTVSLTYFDEDLPTEYTDFSEENLGLFGIDTIDGEFKDISPAVFDFSNNTVTFSLSDCSCREFTIGYRTTDTGEIVTLNAQLTIEGMIVTRDSIRNTEGPYRVGIAPPGDVVISSALLFFRTDTTASYTSLAMAYNAGDYFAEIPGLPEGGLVQYYIEVEADFQTITVPALNPSTSPQNLTVLNIPFEAGDVDQDGDIDIFDLLGILKVISGKVEQTLAADCDENGKIDIFDLLFILKRL